jgi:DeoR/GlpR family transcriptional regulator of sugar metabolism
MNAENQRHRLKQKDLVALIFVLFSEEYDRTGADSISDIEIPLTRIRAYLEGKVGIKYSSDTWIGTQIHKYEEELGSRLFRKSEGSEGPALGLCKDLDTYAQKRHLYITQKIRAANGVFDLIRNSRGGSAGNDSLRILLEAGSTVTRVAEIIAESLQELDWRWEVSTHNLGVIESLGRTSPGFERVRISVPEGHFDPATNLILGDSLELYTRQSFDWIIQGTSFLSGGKLFVERPYEAAVKSRILHSCVGAKVLVLTGHEVAGHPPSAAAAFGSIGDFDYIVHPALPESSTAWRRLAGETCSGEAKPSVFIRNWSYEILKMRP